MKKNMNTIDRVVRAIIAVAIAVLYFNGIIGGTVGLIFMAVAVILLATSLVSTCPLYLLFGLSTLRKKMSTKE
ncbi:MAG: DUF2892 domain-containing protein [Cyclobacteriaceae bacterium]|nr:DUF2892 domain-containing protein [Cyclobacteriaceae bacterium]MDH5251057.1 DUF2892 domain-containing protein [Cyclobacteriaceae bacterium]